MTTKLLIAVKSCQQDADRGYHDAILETWGKRLWEVSNDADILFFTGSNHPGFTNFCIAYDLPETILMDVSDDYNSLPFKTREILRYVLVHRDHDYVFLCDTDTYIVPDLLLKSGFEQYDYSGRFGNSPAIGTMFPYTDGRGIHYDACHPWASGMGYFLSRKAAEIVADTEPDLWAEDMYVGASLGPYIQSGEITAANLDIENKCLWHFPKRLYGGHPYDLKFGWMKQMQEQHG
jgi:hypothetical protein